MVALNYVTQIGSFIQFPRPAISSSKYFLRSKLILEYFFDISITFYTAKIMILSQKPAQSMEKLCLPRKKQ